MRMESDRGSRTLPRSALHAESEDQAAEYRDQEKEQRAQPPRVKHRVIGPSGDRHCTRSRPYFARQRRVLSQKGFTPRASSRSATLYTIPSFTTMVTRRISLM